MATGTNFYNGVTLANRATIDAAAGGTIMEKLPSEAFNIIDEIATNLYSYGQERTDKRTAGIHSIDPVSALSAQMTALTHKVDNLGAAMWNGAPIGPCGACGLLSIYTPALTIRDGVVTPTFHGVTINNKDHRDIINHNSKTHKKRRAI
ncbi:UNVERIFIED_CONTAM: hypothetical protein Slati_2686700 [Sesamum latifolium]|uniref:Uncharacterized protein n=1 Tax=Sesamum latifolium TaxID=2727402 RepID=A0AAW2VUV0_9LAMI